MNETLTVGGLFAGIGGLELGLERAGFKARWLCEYDPESKKPHEDQYAVRILRERFPDAKVLGDIKRIDFSNLPPVDVLTGGFPCQDISNAGKRAGLTGSRSGLWVEFARAISECRPRFVVIENVAALLGRGLGTVLCDLAALGYDAEWYCLPASAVGAPHQRDRIIILAYPDEKGLQRREKTRDTQESRKETLEQSERQCEPREWTNWAVEPRLGRVADGVPNRVDRLKGLGNAVVPQVAEAIGRAIQQRRLG